MAVVKGPALSIEASGNLGAICYSRWRGLQIARDVWSGTVPNTSKQVTIQQRLTTCSQKWGYDLSESERESWRSLAREALFYNRFGEPVHYSGYNLFVSRNMNRIRWGMSVLFSPIEDSKLMEMRSNSMYYQATHNRINCRIYQYPTGYWPEVYEVFYAGPYDTPGRRAIEPEYKFWDYETVTSQWIRITVVTPGKYYWVRLRLGDKCGIVSPFTYRHVAT